VRYHRFGVGDCEVLEHHVNAVSVNHEAPHAFLAVHLVQAHAVDLEVGLRIVYEYARSTIQINARRRQVKVVLKVDGGVAFEVSDECRLVPRRHYFSGQRSSHSAPWHHLRRAHFFAAPRRRWSELTVKRRRRGHNWLRLLCQRQVQ